MPGTQANSRRWSFLSLRVVVYLLIALFALDRLIAAHARLWRSYSPRFYRERVEACRAGRWDLVLVGASPVMGGINADVLQGIRVRGTPVQRAFNLGLPLATASEIYHAVKHGLPKPPRVLLYGITASDINEDRVEPQGPCDLMSLSESARWIRERPEATAWCIRQLLQERCARMWKLYYYRLGIRLWLADWIEQRWPGTCPEAAAAARAGREHCAALHTSHGLVPLPPVPPSLSLASAKAAGGGKLGDFPFLDHYHISGYVRHVNRLLDWADEHGVAVILVDMPVTTDLEIGPYADAFKAYRVVLADLERKRNLNVLRPTRESVGLTDADFSDWIHLNADGNARFSAWLRRTLDQSGGLQAQK
jgi:hypothetical protein